MEREGVKLVADTALCRKYCVVGQCGADAVLSFHFGVDGGSCDVSSHSLPLSITSKLDKHARELFSSGSGESEIVKFVKDRFSKNRLLMFADEITKVKTLTNDPEAVQITSAANGKISVKCQEKNSEVVFLLKISKQFPVEPLAIEIQKSSYHPEITSLFEIHATNIGKKASMGFLAKESVRVFDPKMSPEDVEENFSHLAIRHDMQVLEKSREWSQLPQNRKGRRVKQLFIKNEKEYEESERLKHEAAQQLPQRKPFSGIYPVCDFLVSQFGRALPYVKCSRCKEGNLFDNTKEIPLKTYCGHWFHEKCLELEMTRPPFGAECPEDGCCKRLFHNKWTSDVGLLERRWAMFERQKRELEEAESFFSSLVAD